MLNLNGLTKRKLKILLCSAGIIVAMSLVATIPSLGHDSINRSSETGKVSALKPPAGIVEQARRQGGVNLSSSTTGSPGAGGDYNLQGTTTTSPQTAPTDNNGNSGSPVTAPPTEPKALYPIDPTPKCLYGKSGIRQPYGCPVCQGATTADGLRYPCGPCYGGTGTEIMCANPL